MTKAGLVLLVVALAAGGAIGFVAGSSSSGPAADPEGTGGPGSRERPRDVYVPDRVAPGSDGGGASLAELLEGIATGEAAENGRGTIMVRVETEDGEPLSDVVLRAELMEERFRARDSSGAPPEEKDIEEAVKELVKGRRKKLSARREARTGKDGTCTIEGITDGKYRVMAYLRGWQVSQRPGSQAYNVRAGQTVDYIARPMVGVPVVIVNALGQEPKKPMIMAKGGQYPRTHPWSREHSTIHLQPGSYTLQAMGGEFGELKSDEIELELKAGESIAEMTFVVNEKPGIKGKVTFPKGLSQTYGQIGAIRVIDGQEPDPERIVGSQKQSYVYQGRREFVIADLEPGTWIVGLAVNGAVLVHETVTVGNGVIEVDLVVPEPDPEDSVLVTVLSPDGKMLRTARVWGGYSVEGSGPMWGNRQATLNEDGTWRVPHYSRQNWQPEEGGRYTVNATDPKYGQTQVEYDKETTRSLTVQFNEPGSVIVTLSGYKGTVYQDATRITLARKSGSGGGGRSMPMHSPFGFGGRGGGLDKDGVQKFKAIAPGEYEVQVYLNGKGWNQQLVHQETIAVKEGENAVSVALPPLYQLTVIVPAPAEGKKHRYSLSPQRRIRGSYWGSPPQPKVEGTTITFESVPAGEYVFHVSGGRLPQRMNVTIPGTGVVRFAAQVYNARVVQIDDPEKYLGSVGLKEGDLVIGLDGVEFKDDSHMRARFMEARAKESSTLLVQRGAKKFNVVVDVAKIRGKDAGGMMRDTTR